MKVAITGEQGFIGYHLVQYYKWIKNYDVVLLGRNYLENITKVGKCDFLIHCAAVNRGSDILQKNVLLTKSLVQELKNSKISIDIKFISSTQVNLNNDYGNSKLISSDILEEYCEENGTKYECYYLPNIYGEFGKPNYNSFINTFCWNLVKSIPLTINDNSIDLCYVQDAVRVIDNELSSFPVERTTVLRVYQLLQNIHADYSIGIFPSLSSRFERNLFNVYRGFQNNTFVFPRFEDSRGYLVELVKSRCSTNQIFFSTTNPGVTRGEHFHFRKIERFCVLSGKAEINIRKVGSSTIKTFKVEGKDNQVVDIPNLHTHNIVNVGTSVLTCLFWVDEIYNEQSPDTFYEKVKQTE